MASIPSTPAPPRYRYGSGEVAQPPLPSYAVWLLVVVGVALIGSYWRDAVLLYDRWTFDPSWSHGFLVPGFSAFFVALRWKTLRALPVKRAWVGLPILIFGGLAHVFLLVHGEYQTSHLSLLISLTGAVLFLLGFEHLKILWLPIAFLLFMVPIPQALYVRVTTPMQDFAASAGVWLLPLVGIPADRHGLVIDVQMRDGTPSTLLVEEACSGMRMLVAFVALAVALAYSTDRPVWEKLFLGVCAAPVAILCNALRVTLTGVMLVYFGNDMARGGAHQWMGLAMLIPACGMQLAIGWVLSKIFVDSDKTDGGGK